MPESDVPARKPRLRCPECDAPMSEAGSEQTVDRWVEKFVCENCGREDFRGYGRGSV